MTFRRQVEYLCVWFHFTCLCVIGPIFGPAFLLFLVYHGPLSRVFAAAYLFFTWFNWKKPHEGGYTSFRVPSCYFKMIQSYFPIIVHKEEVLEPDKSYIMGMHPHGILPSTHAGYIVDLIKERSPLIWHTCLVPANFMLPVLRDYCLAIAGIGASEASIMGVLNRPGGGHVIGIYLGGAKETEFNNENTLVLKNRKGFCRLALKSGTSIVPSYTFGENDVFTSIKFPDDSWVRRLQDCFLRTMGFAFPIVKGAMRLQYQLVMPRRRPLNLIVGKAIKVERVENPTKEEIEKLHEKYLASLKKIFDDNKVRSQVRCRCRC